MSGRKWDAVVIGSGPNGLAAAITLARAGLKVCVLEGHSTPGGGVRSAELTHPGFIHDVCSAAHPLGVASPFMKSMPLESFGLEWCHPRYPAAHALADGKAALQAQSLEETERLLGEDGPRWRKTFAPLVEVADQLFEDLLGPLPFPPQHPWAMARFGVHAWRSALGWGKRFRTPEARALFAGHAAHSWLPLNQALTAAVGVMLSVSAHAVGWPVAKGGSQQLTAALVGYFKSLGGEVRCDSWINHWSELLEATAYFFDTSPQALAEIAIGQLPSSYGRRLKCFRHGPAAWKLDLALSGPIPWRHPELAHAGTVHVGGTAEEIAEAEAQCWRGQAPKQPFMLVGQQSACDATRAPAGQHTAWIYAHVPARHDDPSMTQTMLDHLEKFAPGFQSRILGQAVHTPADFQRYNPNYRGGDIIGGVQDWMQMFTRPVARWNPYSTPNPRIFLCSASTPPGAGVHGMCGWHSARTALRRLWGFG